MESTRLCYYTVEASSVASVLWKNSLGFYSSRERLPAVILALSKHQRTTLWAVPSVPCLSLQSPLPPPKGDSSPDFPQESRGEKIYQTGGRVRRCTPQQVAYLQEISMNRSLVETYGCHFVIHYKLSQASSARQKPPSYGKWRGFHLPNAMCPIHGLQVSHWVPVMFHKYNCVSPCQIKSQSTNMSGEQKNIYRRVIIKPACKKKLSMVSFI